MSLSENDCALPERFGERDAEAKCAACNNLSSREGIPSREEIGKQQDEDTILAELKLRVKNKRPDWTEIANRSQEVKFYWHRIKSMEVKDGVLCYI